MLIRATISALLVGCLFAGSLTIAASNQANQQSSEVVLNGCEGNNSYLSNAHHLAGAGGTVIAIAKLGEGEVRRAVNRRRLHNIRIFLTDFGWHRDPATVITAEGERVKGYGRVELYVRGNLFAVLAVRRNQDLLVGSCIGPDRNLYPYLDRKPRRSTKKHNVVSDITGTISKQAAPRLRIISTVLALTTSCGRQFPEPPLTSSPIIWEELLSCRRLPNGNVAAYLDLQSVSVRRGQTLGTGDAIGTVRAAGDPRNQVGLHLSLIHGQYYNQYRRMRQQGAIGFPTKFFIDPLGPNSPVNCPP